MKVRNLIDLDDISLAKLEEIITLANEIKKNPSAYADKCRGKILATLFYEPSTRTQMSFQTAMLRLGGQIIGFDDPSNSSVAKGETLKDTIRVISGYADLIALRHPLEGSAKAASLYSKSGVINAGDGGHLHPTQTLTDLVTLQNETGRLDRLTIGVCGDLKNGRTVHSLIKTMSRYPRNRFICISSPGFEIPQYVKDIMCSAGCDYQEVSSLEEVIGELDVLYMTRIQKERMERSANNSSANILDVKTMALAKATLRVLHPLPRVDEITVEVDEDPRAKYFEQTEYGLFARMALIITMIEDEDRSLPKLGKGTNIERCKNIKCITKTETYLPERCRRIGGEMVVCEYCEERMLQL